MAWFHIRDNFEEKLQFSIANPNLALINPANTFWKALEGTPPTENTSRTGSESIHHEIAFSGIQEYYGGNLEVRTAQFVQKLETSKLTIP